MPTLPKDLRSKLEKVVIAARDEATEGAKAALIALGVGDGKKPGHLDAEGEKLRRRLRARGRQAGDLRRPDDSQETRHLAEECALRQHQRCHQIDPGSSRSDPARIRANPGCKRCLNAKHQKCQNL
jgi:hypothetical protein